MIKHFLPIIFILSLLLAIITGCGENKDTRLGRCEEQVRNLQIENAQLRKENAITNIRETGGMFTVIVLATSIIVVNNLIWLVAYRRKR